MKKIIYSTKVITLMLCCMALCFLNSGCSKDDDSKTDDTASIVGSWKCTSGDVVLTVKFNSNKTGTETISSIDGSASATYSFEYDYIEKDRRLQIIGSGLDGAYTVSLAATVLRLYCSDGVHYYELIKSN